MSAAALSTAQIIRTRLNAQQLSGKRAATPEEVVGRLGAVQAQDAPGGKWAVALRTDPRAWASLDEALAGGKILRTHVLRPTWHLVLPADLRWMLALSAARIRKAMSAYWKQHDLDERLLARSDAAIQRILEGGNQLTRAELSEALAHTGKIPNPGGERLGHMLLHAEIGAILCSGAQRGKHQTYALLDERAPNLKGDCDEEAALATLTRRYFASRGPATLADFAWWSGLRNADAKRGLALAAKHLEKASDGQQSVWFAATPLAAGRKQPAHLLPNYDEYIVGYADRSAIFDSRHAARLDARHNPLFQHTLLVGGRIVGTWRRTAAGAEPRPFESLGSAEAKAVAEAAERYHHYLRLPRTGG